MGTGDLRKPLLNKSGGVFRIPPNLDGGAFGQRHFQHDFHELVYLFSVQGITDMLVLNLIPDFFSFIHHFRLSVRLCRRRCRRKE